MYFVHGCLLHKIEANFCDVNWKVGVPHTQPFLYCILHFGYLVPGLSSQFLHYIL